MHQFEKSATQLMGVAKLTLWLKVLPDLIGLGLIGLLVSGLGMTLLWAWLGTPIIRFIYGMGPVLLIVLVFSGPFLLREWRS